MPHTPASRSPNTAESQIILLPAELHDAILQHLSKADIQTYRLICRNFAENSAQWLFRKFHFTSSLPDLKRLSGISKSDIRLCVKTLVWSTDRSDFEAEHVLEGLRVRELKNILGRSSQDQLQRPQAANREHAVGEGNVRANNSIGVFFLQAIFSGLPNVQKLHIRTSQGRYEMHASLVAAHLAGHPLSKLRVQYLLWKSVPAMVSLEHAIESLTSLRLQICLPGDVMARVSERPGSIPAVVNLSSLRECLGSAINLRTLEIRLADSNWWTGEDFGSSHLRLQDIIPEPNSYPYLRKFVVGQCDTSEDFLESFLRAHCENLRVLKIQSMRMHPRGSWSRLFQNVQPFLRLITVELSGYIENDVRHDTSGWALDEQLEWELKDYLLGKQTECPLR